MIDADCLYCGRFFFAREADVKRGYGKYCSRKCSVAAGNVARPVGASYNALNGRARSLWIRRHKVEPSCRICGAIPADIHHDDGNRRNNADENLIPLCRPHHVALENQRHPKRRKRAA